MVHRHHSFADCSVCFLQMATSSPEVLSLGTIASGPTVAPALYAKPLHFLFLDVQGSPVQRVQDGAPPSPHLICLFPLFSAPAAGKCLDVWCVCFLHFPSAFGFCRAPAVHRVGVAFPVVAVTRVWARTTSPVALG